MKITVSDQNAVNIGTVDETHHAMYENRWTTKIDAEAWVHRKL